MPVQGIVGFRLLFGSRIALTVHGSVSPTRDLVASTLWFCSVFCFTSESHRDFRIPYAPRRCFTAAA
ncbi:hypothetical protein HAX54_008997, partial [Datura stramonium]|nr:hypothetical protein [Datura stramonium]